MARRYWRWVERAATLGIALYIRPTTRGGSVNGRCWRPCASSPRWRYSNTTLPVSCWYAALENAEFVLAYWLWMKGLGIMLLSALGPLFWRPVDADEFTNTPPTRRSQRAMGWRWHGALGRR